MLERMIEVARAVSAERYADASVIFLAGSPLRGEGTAYSDLDLVVIRERVSHASRESFRFRELPVEAFIHDPETLNYFFMEVDRPSGIPALPQMVKEGLEIPESTDLSRSLKQLAESVIDMGPPLLTLEEQGKLRYAITDQLDDLRDPRSYKEMVASAAQLYESLANYYLRTRGLWSARSKMIPRVLERVDGDFGERYCRSFEALFKSNDPKAVIALTEDVLAPDGGPLFDGHTGSAPPEWRRPLV